MYLLCYHQFDKQTKTFLKIHLVQQGRVKRQRNLSWWRRTALTWSVFVVVEVFNAVLPCVDREAADEGQWRRPGRVKMLQISGSPESDKWSPWNWDSWLYRSLLCQVLLLRVLPLPHPLHFKVLSAPLSWKYCLCLANKWSINIYHKHTFREPFRSQVLFGPQSQL